MRTVTGLHSYANYIIERVVRIDLCGWQPESDWPGCDVGWDARESKEPAGSHWHADVLEIERSGTGILNLFLSPVAALGSAAMLGVSDFTGGYAGRKTSTASVAIGVEITGLVALPVAILALPQRFDLVPTIFAFAGGAIGGLGLIAFYRAMMLNLVGVVAPITGVIAAALPTGVGVVTGDKLHAGQLFGIGTGLIAIALINGVGGRTTRGGARTAVLLASFAGAAFGLFFVFFHIGSSSGAAAFVSGRLGSATAGLCFALVTHVSPVPKAGALGLIATAGTLDGIGVVLYLFATFHGLLSLSAVLTSFYPAFTVLCARVFLRERLTAVQASGAALAALSVALIAAG